MITYIAMGAVILLYLLFGIFGRGRQSLIHLLELGVNVTVSFLLSNPLSKLLCRVIKKRISEVISITELDEAVISTAIRVLVFVLCFALLWLLLRLIVALSMKGSKNEKKVSRAITIPAALIGGIVCALIISLPFHYYLPVKDRIINALDNYEVGLSADLSSLDRFRLNDPLTDKIDALIEKPFSKVSYENQTFTLDEFLNCQQITYDLLRDPLSKEILSEFVDKLPDSRMDWLCGKISAELPVDIRMTLFRDLFTTDLPMSAKLSALNNFDNFAAKMYSSQDADMFLDILNIISGSPEEIRAYVSIANSANLASHKITIAKNAEFIRNFLTAVADSQPLSQIDAWYNAEAINYIMNIRGNTVMSANGLRIFDIGTLDGNKVADYIAQAPLVQQAYIETTKAGTIFNPAYNETGYNRDHEAQLAAERLVNEYGFAPDSDLVRSVLAYYTSGQ